MTSRAQGFERSALAYRKPDPGTEPPYLHPPYASTAKRAPSQPLVVLPTTLSEVTGPMLQYGRTISI